MDEITAAPDQPNTTPPQPSPQYDFVSVVLISIGAIALGRLINAILKPQEKIKQKACKLHVWALTPPQPGAVQVLKCTQCPKIAGPTNEWGQLARSDHDES